MADTSERQDNGRFAKGNRGGPGRPRREVEELYLTAMRECVSLEDWREIVRVAVRMAKGGNDAPRAWLAKYLLPLQE